MSLKGPHFLSSRNTHSLFKNKICISTIGTSAQKIKKDKIIQNKLIDAGFSDISIVAKDVVLDFCRENGFPFLFVIYLHFEGVSSDGTECCDLLSSLRASGFGGFIVVIDEAASFQKCQSILVSGANDYCIDGRNLILEKEVFDIFVSRRNVFSSLWDPGLVGEMGLFRSLGLTSCQISVLAEFSKDFSRLADLSMRIGKTEDHVRKIFSTIYGKMNDKLGINNQAQLAHLLTICSNLGGIRKKLTFVPSI